jgi:hypothetical protein
MLKEVINVSTFCLKIESSPSFLKTTGSVLTIFFDFSLQEKTEKMTMNSMV